MPCVNMLKRKTLHAINYVYRCVCVHVLVCVPVYVCILKFMLSLGQVLCRVLKLGNNRIDIFYCVPNPSIWMYSLLDSRTNRVTFVPCVAADGTNELYV